MSMFDRLCKIVKSNINSALDSCEDPAKMIDQSLIDLANNLAKVKEGAAGVLGEEKRAKRALDANTADIKKYDNLARKALSAGNESEARTFLSKKRSFEERGVELQKVYDAASANAQKMRGMHDKLVDDIEALKSKREMIKAKVAVAKTQDMVGKFAANSPDVETAKALYDRMESKADMMLDKADAMIDLNNERLDEAELLAKQYTTDAHGADVDDELARLKKEMGL